MTREISASDASEYFTDNSVRGTALLGLLRRCGEYVLSRMHVDPQKTELNLLLVGPQESRRLKKTWLGEDRPADVLSFPMDNLRPGTPAQPRRGILGDLALCPQVAAEQARAAAHPLEHELLLLAVHGILHLLGYDHASAADREKMFALQGELLTGFFTAAQLGSPGVNIIFFPNPEDRKRAAAPYGGLSSGHQLR